MNHKGILLFLIPLLQSCFTVKSNQHFTYQKLDAEEYHRMLRDSSSYYLIDVRTPAEYRKAHVNGAMNVSFLEFHFGKDVDSLSRDKTTFLYCHTCHRSPFAARVMKRKGFKRVYDLEGGFAEWLKKELPVAR